MAARLSGARRTNAWMEELPMKFGHFDDKAREYVIETPRTPYPWINYLGCEKFFGIISNTAGGYCFYRDARLRRITRYRYNNKIGRASCRERV